MFGLMQFRRDACAVDDEKRQWQLHYCGTCKTMGREYGQRARLLLNHDAVFLAELLTALGGRDAGEWGGAFASRNCFRLPSKREMPVLLRYAAAATVLLSEYKVADHEADGGRIRWACVRRLFSRSFRNVRLELAALGFPLADIKAAGAVGGRIGKHRHAAGPTAEATALVSGHGARVAGMAGREDALASMGTTSVTLSMCWTRGKTSSVTPEPARSMLCD
jgi:Family of unknown function (DUF5685)